MFLKQRYSFGPGIRNCSFQIFWAKLTFSKTCNFNMFFFTVSFFSKWYNSEVRVHISNFILRSCSSMFASCPYKLGQKRVLIFTNTDDPHANNKELKKRAKMKGTDLCDLGIGVELLHMKPGMCKSASLKTNFV